MGGLMYYANVDAEKDFLHMLRRIFNSFVDKHESYEGAIHSGITCPKCEIGQVVCYGKVISDKGGFITSMITTCDNCHEEFKLHEIEEDIYNNLPHTMISQLETPLGQFKVQKNGESIMFRHESGIVEIDGFEFETHTIRIDTSLMEQGDHVQTGITGSKFEHVTSDQMTMYIKDENEDYYMVIKSVDFSELDFPIEFFGENYIDNYSYILDGWSGEGFSYLIKTDPQTIKDKNTHDFRVITLVLSWSKKSVNDEYEWMVEQATGW